MSSDCWKLHGYDFFFYLYLRPEDWGRRAIDRQRKSLKKALRDLLPDINTSAQAWSGGKDSSEAEKVYFDPWASDEKVSLYYLFNKLKSPDPKPEDVRNRYSREAMRDLLASTASYQIDDCEGLALNGLKTTLYPYQARSASHMIQRETAPQLQLDPRLEIRYSPTGQAYYFGARDGSFLQEARYYETNRGGILAETMGLGKTIICLAVILATKGHLPQIPPAYQLPPPVRERVGSLADVAANIIGRNAIPGIAYINQLEAAEDLDMSRIKNKLEQYRPTYEIPAEVPRMNRSTRIPPPRSLVMCSGTLVIVPRNLLHQWQAEIRKHIHQKMLKILIMDTAPKRGAKRRGGEDADHDMELRSKLPTATELLEFDLILFTRARFEQEIQDGADDQGRRLPSGAPLICQCPYIGASRVRDCSCLAGTQLYESPLKKLHWLRIIIDEGHNFAFGLSNAVQLAKQLQTERRWVVSGTPAKNLVGVEVDLSALEESNSDPSLIRELTLEQRKNFSLDDDNMKGAKALGSLASNFLMVRPWSDSPAVDEGRLDWDDYIYRHEHQYRKTFSGFSNCFLRTLEGLVVKTRPEDVERDIVLPPMKHRVVYLKPCWFDKMTANLFIQVLRANAVTSERSDVDYLFHKNSTKARHSLIRNLRQSNFTWTGFSLEDVGATLETSRKYLDKEDKNCSAADARMLLESCAIVEKLRSSDAWIALSKAHEVGLAIEDWPENSVQSFALVAGNPALIGITQLLEGQSYVDSHILSDDPSYGLFAVGETIKEGLKAIEEADGRRTTHDKEDDEKSMIKTGVPSSCVGVQPLTSKKAPVTPGKPSPKKKNPRTSKPTMNSSVEDPINSPTRTRKRRLTLADELADLPASSPLRTTRVLGTTSAKLTYLMEMVLKHHTEEKIIIFYDGDNAAFYIAQFLEMLYINHRIYARTLDNTTRSHYVSLFNEDPDIRVLLIDVACGALGLNLNAASVVSIVNPINRPEIEAQAIKRAHRIGQTREVLVETLVLEGTIEEAIFNQAKNMSRNEHLEAKTLEDNDKIVNIIQNAQALHVKPDEVDGVAQYALFKAPQQVFGRAGRHKYQKYGQTGADSKLQDPSRTKRARTKNTSPKSTLELRDPPPQNNQGDVAPAVSIFGNLT
ncbi:hypothetical protein BU24DRAFT_420442 [Aaosphaeria arxii CBS 175.79]|uniref:Helicase C-terminal domain-containing protein n=1 Tax=Aaosphaeria arxii CBS 175.79 TaxID=1450172 RepID=A0A6A5XW37_9PLEO|nr:uncharacterized protein BU24DRAFT_420442 [Aaosphaeria arxii CBS 175.79]KAF2017392.1 hypothetical protein BU24DRAFT_420442 [Aaosphaeria arxii CBS 175.79]